MGAYSVHYGMEVFEMTSLDDKPYRPEGSSELDPLQGRKFS